MGKIAVVVLSLACASFVFAQVDEDPDKSPSPQEPAASDSAQRASATTEDDLTAVQAQRDYASVRQYIVALEDRIELLEMRLARLTDLEERVLLLTDQVDTLSDAGGLAQKVMGAVPTDSELRRQFGAAAQGKVHIVNYTGQERTIFVNGVRWNALKGRSYVYAPVGRVAMQPTATCDPTVRDDWKYEDGELQMTFEIYE